MVELPPAVPVEAPDFVQKVTAMIIAGKGDELPVFRHQAVVLDYADLKYNPSNDVIVPSVIVGRRDGASWVTTIGDADAVLPDTRPIRAATPRLPRFPKPCRSRKRKKT